MNKPLIAATVVLCFALAVPATGLAAPHQRPATPPGQAKKGAEAPAASGAGRGAASENSRGQSEQAQERSQQRSQERSQDRTRQRDRSRDESGSAEPSSSVEPSGTPRGIDNALSRIETNLAKAEAKVAAGTKKRVPRGLLNAWQVLSRIASGTVELSETPPPAGAADNAD